MRRRSAASASRERVKAFSLTRSCCCAASHSFSETTGGVFIVTFPFACSSFLSLLIAMSFLLSFSEKKRLLCKIPELINVHRQNSTRRCSSGNDYYCTFDACWAHRQHLRCPRLRLSSNHRSGDSGGAVG